MSERKQSVGKVSQCGIQTFAPVAMCVFGYSIYLSLVLAFGPAIC
jgi:hypothetical protein